MILLGVGANLPSDIYGPPRATCGSALAHLHDNGTRIIQRAPWYRSAPVPMSDQPWYVNGVVSVETGASPEELMRTLLDVENHLGRQRGARNAARIVDLDILDFNGQTINATFTGGVALQIPHPRMSERAFVTKPLRDIAPNWVHPVSGQGVSQINANLPTGQQTEPMPDADGLFGTEWIAG